MLTDLNRIAAAPSDTRIDANFDVILATVDRLLDGFLAMLPLLAAAILVFVLLLFAARGVRYLAEKALRRSSNQSAATAIGRLLYVAMVALAVLIAVTIAFPSMTPGRLISVLGIGGVAIGFAFKDIFQNLLAGILILLRHPFRVGDEITTGEFTGTVEAIETRATFIRTYDGRRVIIPNGDVYTKPVTVISAYDMLRSEYDVGIGYGDDLAQAKAIALEAIQGVDGVLADPAPDVLVWELGESSKNIRIRWWTRPARGDVLRIRDARAEGSGRGDRRRGDGPAVPDTGRAVPRPDRGDRRRPHPPARGLASGQEPAQAAIPGARPRGQ